jgi:uncharacterized protein YxeA
MKKILCVVSLLSLLLISCSSEKEIVIDPFSDFPEEIDGCACYFSADKNDFVKGSYIYADNYHDHAYVSINGKMQLFTLVKQTEVTESYWVKVYTNSEYEVTVEAETLWQADETWLQKGEISIKTRNGKKIKETIYGECGC